MARKPRNIYPGDISHTSFRTYNREFLFRNADDHKILCRALVRSKVRFGVKIYTLVGMSNHYHFMHDAPTEWHEETEYARQQKELGLSPRIGDFLRECLSLYVRVFNLLKGREGGIVKDRTSTVRQDAKAQEMSTAFYGFFNPVKAKMVKHPKDYCYHNYHLYAYGRLPPPLQEFKDLFDFPDWYMELGDTMPQRQREFRRRSERYAEQHGYKKFRGASNTNGPGRNKWRDAIEEFIEFSHAFSYQMKEESKQNVRAPPKKNSKNKEN